MGEWWARLNQSTSQPDKQEQVDSLFALAESVVVIPIDDIDTEDAAIDEDCCVHPDNWSALELFLKICHLWRYHGMGGILGLDWTEARSYLSLCQYEFSPADIEKVLLISQAATSVLNKT